MTLPLIQTISTALGLVIGPDDEVITLSGVPSWSFIHAAEGALTESKRRAYTKMLIDWAADRCLEDNSQQREEWYLLTAPTEVRLAALGKVLEEKQ